MPKTLVKKITQMEMNFRCAAALPSRHARARAVSNTHAAMAYTIELGLQTDSETDRAEYGVTLWTLLRERKTEIERERESERIVRWWSPIWRKKKLN